MKPLKHYPCRAPNCSMPSVYFAIGNTPRFGHLCKDCWSALPPVEQAVYEFCALELQVINKSKS